MQVRFPSEKCAAPAAPLKRTNMCGRRLRKMVGASGDGHPHLCFGLGIDRESGLKSDSHLSHAPYAGLAIPQEGLTFQGKTFGLEAVGGC